MSLDLSEPEWCCHEYLGDRKQCAKGQEKEHRASHLQFQCSGRRIANLGYIVSVEVAGVTEEDTAPKTR